MDIAFVFQKVGETLTQVWAMEFTFAGITTTIGAVVIWSALAAILIKFIKG